MEVSAKGFPLPPLLSRRSLTLTTASLSGEGRGGLSVPAVPHRQTRGGEVSPCLWCFCSTSPLHDLPSIPSSSRCRKMAPPQVEDGPKEALSPVQVRRGVIVRDKGEGSLRHSRGVIAHDKGEGILTHSPLLVRLPRQPSDPTSPAVTRT